MLGAETGAFQLKQSLIGRPKQTRRATELYAYLRVKTHKRTRSKAYFTLIGQKNTKISGISQTPERLQPFRNCPDKTMSPGALPP